MDTLTDIRFVRGRIAAWKREGHKLAFVPTMGNLHTGHASLIARARELAPRVVVSVFVNPLQFGPGEDFERYPRTPANDATMLEEGGADILFAPTADEMYPSGAGRTAIVDVPDLADQLEGRFRPGHFAGVCTVVAKLFNIVQPDFAVFGEKDFQQLVVIRRMVRDLCMPIEIVGAPIVRAEDGLALSSRNQYLDPRERATAPRLNETLRRARERLLAGEGSVHEIESKASSELVEAGFRPDYVTIRRATDLRPAQPGDRDLVILATARLGAVRLLDNLRVDLASR